MSNPQNNTSDTVSSTASKHHVKGTAVRNFQKYVELKLDEGYFKELLMATGLSSTEIIISSTWYSVDRYIAMQKKCAEKLGVSLKDFVVGFTRYHLEIDMNGVYQFFMRASGPTRVLANLPRIDSAYSDYTKMEMISNEKGICVSEIHVPKQYSEWYVWTLLGGFTGLLNVCKTPLRSFKVLNRAHYEKDGEIMEVTRMESTY